MSRLGLRSQVFHGELYLGELDVIPVKDRSFVFPNNEIRIQRLSPPSERCHPLSILQTISSFSVCCKLESSSLLEQPNLINLHATCHFGVKTAVALVGEEEIHLVAMLTKQKKYPCFWCYSVPKGLYNSSVALLDMRCLSIVFDLDETLIVANTMKTFEDKIENVKAWIAREPDPQRSAMLHAEMKRYIDDRAILRQYLDNDSVNENGRVYRAQMEEVPPLSDTHERIYRPIIRLPEKNIVLTRINPEIRDTSVLVRLRPAWEDLRNYLTARGRKRFEVYVCTMAERDYALEIWRLLDPEANLIGFNQLLSRVICVKSGSRKSLLNVFQDGICHSKMAMVIDDRLKVWEDKDQPRVHVVPAFSPYSAPQAETANAVPVLCVARNVACNVRGCFYKEFDEIFIRRITEVFYEDDLVSLPPSPDVSNYLMSEDAGFVPNGIPPPFPEGMNGIEVERRLNRPDDRNVNEPATQSTNNDDSRSETSQAPASNLPNAVNPTALGPLLPSQKPGLLGLPARREGFSDHFDVKRGIGNLKFGLDSRNQSSGDPPILARVPSQLAAPLGHAQGGGWLVEDDTNRGNLKNRPVAINQEYEVFKPDKQRAHQSMSFMAPGSTSTGSMLQTSEVKVEEVHNGHNLQKPNLPLAGQIPDAGVSQNQPSSNSKDFPVESGKINLLPSPLSIGVLHEIARRCSSKVEFKSVLSTSKDLQFSVEVLFTGDKIGVGMGKTRKDAQQQAAENALQNLAEKYVAFMAPRSGVVDKDFDKLSHRNENGFLWEPESAEQPKEEGFLPNNNNTEGADIKAGSASTIVGNHLMQKRTNSHRFQQSGSIKQAKQDDKQGSQNFSGSWQPKNGHYPVS